MRPGSIGPKHWDLRFDRSSLLRHRMESSCAQATWGEAVVTKRWLRSGGDEAMVTQWLRKSATGSYASSGSGQFSVNASCWNGYLADTPPEIESERRRTESEQRGQRFARIASRHCP